MSDIQERCISDQDDNTIVKKWDRCFGETTGYCKICNITVILITGKQGCDGKLWICNTCYSNPDVDDTDINRWECQSCHRVLEISLFLEYSKLYYLYLNISNITYLLS